LRDFIRLLVAQIKNLESGLNSYALALYTFKKSYPEQAQLIDDLLTHIRQEPVPRDETRDQFEEALEKLLQHVPESALDSEWTKLAESAPKEWIN
jgi:hypothetical protein